MMHSKNKARSLAGYQVSGSGPNFKNAVNGKADVQRGTHEILVCATAITAANNGVGIVKICCPVKDVIGTKVGMTDENRRASITHS